VAAVPVSIQLFESCHLLGARWIQMDVAHQLQQVRLFLAANGFVAILKQMPRPTMRAIEPARVAAQQLSHFSAAIPFLARLTNLAGSNRKGKR
jgi:hypothetical protein